MKNSIFERVVKYCLLFFWRAIPLYFVDISINEIKWNNNFRCGCQTKTCTTVRIYVGMYICEHLIEVLIYYV